MTKKLLNIHRQEFDNKKYESDSSYGSWRVIINSGGKGYANSFNDKVYGGRNESLEAALIFRDALRLQLSLIDKSDSKGKNAENVSGYSGVSRVDRIFSENGKEYHDYRWVARWTVTVDGKPVHKSKSCAIKKYGEDKAFRMAFKARKDGLKKYDKVVPKYFQTPERKEQKIWRYLDFTKFVSMLESKSLYFSPTVDMSDPFEGSFSKLNKDFRPLISKVLTEKDGHSGWNAKELRESVYLNCWHMNDYESAAMWELYGKSNETVCVQSTYGDYEQSLNDRADVGIVQYVDYKKDWIPDHDPYLAYLYKRKSYEHEREIRGLMRREDSLDFTEELPVDLNQLINKVYISPTAPQWFSELVKSVVNKYGFEFDVAQSSITDEPFF